MKRLAVITSGLILLGTAVAGCGGADAANDQYCDSIGAFQDEFQSVMGDADTSVRDLANAAGRFDDIAGVAPGYVEDDWDAIASALHDVVTAFEDSGVDVDAPLADAAGDVPRENQPSLRRALRNASGGVQQNEDAIVDQVESQCGVDLS